VVFQPGSLGPVTLRNRLIKAATFEGMSRHQEVTDELVDFHRTVAAGGVAMSTVAYCAVAPEGSTDGRTIVLRPQALPGLRRLTDAIHEQGAMASAQIGHAGPVANPAATKLPALGPTRIFSPFGLRRTRAVDDEDIRRITEEFSRGAKLAVDAGFDAIEIHLGHNYLLSAFLSPKLNTRSDRWGGSVTNRSRFPRQVVRAVREAVEDRVAVVAKLNMADGVRGGLWLDESIPIAQMLESDGTLDAIELTGGSSLANPMYLFRGDAPVEEMAATMPGLARAGFKVIGAKLMREYPFEEAFFLPYARQFRRALDLPLILLGGINRLETMEQAVTEGFSFVAMARALLREPDLPLKMQQGASAESLCIHCNKCVPTIYRGTRCVLVETVSPRGDGGTSRRDDLSEGPRDD
jgi:2,4-dienoyl-CoA reductase-like NADH-dependent reductase (Old Yellow Enzyme family)